MIQPLRSATRALRAAATDPAIGLALGIATLCLALQVTGLVEALRFDRAAIDAGAWWRLLTGNFVHLGAGHLTMNLVGLALVVSLVWARFGALEWALLTVLGSLAVGLGLYRLNPAVGWYVGFSGTLHALIVAGSIADLRLWPRSAALLLALVAAKLLWEQLDGPLPGSETTAGGRVVVDSHLYGAIAGAALAPPLLLWRWWRSRDADAGAGFHHGGKGATSGSVDTGEAGARPGGGTGETDDAIVGDAAHGGAEGDDRTAVGVTGTSGAEASRGSAGRAR